MKGSGGDFGGGLGIRLTRAVIFRRGAGVGECPTLGTLNELLPFAQDRTKKILIGAGQAALEALISVSI